MAGFGRGGFDDRRVGKRSLTWIPYRTRGFQAVREWADEIQPDSDDKAAARIVQANSSAPGRFFGYTVDSDRKLNRFRDTPRKWMLRRQGKRIPVGRFFGFG